jgi:hypothetical protein
MVDLNNEYVYLSALAFITILILDFMIVEIVLKLGVFSFGRSMFRAVMILALEVQAVSFYLFNIYPKGIYLYLTIGSFAWGTWSTLYYMLIQQNIYWMKPNAKKGLYLAFALFIAWVLTLAVFSILVGLQVTPFSFLVTLQYLDLVELIYLSLSKFYINYKIYEFSRDKLKSVSPALWTKVKI